MSAAPKHRDPVGGSAAASSNASPVPRDYKIVNAIFVADPAVREALQKEQAIRHEVQAAQVVLREKRGAKDALLRASQPTQDKVTAKVTAQLDAMEGTRSGLQRKIDALRLKQSAIGRARDELAILNLNGVSGRDIGAAEDAKRALEADIAKEAERRAAFGKSLPYATLADADAALEKLKTTQAVATKKGETTHAASLAKQITAAEKARRDVQKFYDMEQALFSKKKKLDGLAADVERRQTARKTLNDDRDALRAKVNDSKAVVAELNALRDELRKLNTDADALRKQRTSARAEAAGSGRGGELGELHAAIDEVAATVKAGQAKIAALTASVPRGFVRVPQEVRGDIVGPGGANVSQLQEDFGVAIDIDRGEAVIVGGAEAIEEAKAAIEAMIVDATENRKEETVQLPAGTAPGLIGAQGSNVNQLQTLSGARIKVDRQSSLVTIIGGAEARAKAKALVEEYVDSNAVEEIVFDPAQREFIMGPKGATVRRLELDHKLKKLRVDRDRGIVVAVGSRAGTAAVKKEIETMLADLTTASVRVDQRMVRLVVGPGGSTVRGMQERTGAHIDLSQAGLVRISGTKDQVQQARLAVEDITRREEVKIPVDRALLDALTTRPLVKGSPAPLPADEDPAAGTPPPSSEAVSEERNSVLEEIKAQTGCDQVSAIHREACVVVRGRREAVAMARGMVEDEARRLAPAKSSVVVPPVLLNYFKSAPSGRRSPATGGAPPNGGPGGAALEKVKAEIGPDLLAMRLDYQTKAFDLRGTEKAVTAAKAEIQSMVAEMAGGIARITVPSHAIGGIIGPQGSTVRALSRDFGVDIEVERGDGSAAVVIFAPPRASPEQRGEAENGTASPPPTPAASVAAGADPAADEAPPAGDIEAAAAKAAEAAAGSEEHPQVAALPPTVAEAARDCAREILLQFGGSA